MSQKIKLEGAKKIVFFTGAVVFPAAEFPLMAKQAGAALIEINPEETPLSEAYDIKLRGPASEMLKQITFA